MAVATSNHPVSTNPRQAEVLEAICVAISEGRDVNGDWSFPTDCLCCVVPPRWNYSYSQEFLTGLIEVVRDYASNFGKGRA